MYAHGLPFDLVVNFGRAVATVQGFKARNDFGVILGLPLVVANILDPSWHMITLGPQFGLFQVTQQRPLPGAISQSRFSP